MKTERASLVAAVEGLATQVATRPRTLVRSLEIGLICATAGALGRGALDPLLGQHLPFSIFFPAIMVAAVFGGGPASLFALVVATLSGWFLFLPPKLSFDIGSGQALQVAVFLALGLFTAGVGLLLRGALIRLETHRSRHEALVFELNERLHKDLAKVATIAQESLRDSGGRLRPGESLVDRLAVLREAHHDLSVLDWRPISLGRVVGRPLRYLAPSDVARIAVEGPDATLDADLAVSLALCVWELADHACRWGALAAPDGRVRLSWRSDGRFISLSWIETDVGRQASIRDLRRRLISERLPWRLEPAAGLIHWSVRFESREPALPAYAPIPRTARAA